MIDTTNKTQPSPSYRWGLAVPNQAGAWVVTRWFKTRRAAELVADDDKTIRQYAIARWLRRTK